MRARLAAIEPLVEQAIAEKKLPGAVVLVGRGDDVVYQKAIGHRALVPARRADDRRHDLRPRVAHQGRGDDDGVMMLVEEGRIGLDDAVASFIPEFGGTASSASPSATC